MSRELPPWESLTSEIVVDQRSYRLRRETVRLPSGLLGQAAELAGEASWDEQEEIELLVLPIGELEAEVRAGRTTAAGAVATISRALGEP